MNIVKTLTVVLLLAAGPVNAQDIATDPALFDVAGVASNDVLNIRQSPDGSSEIIGALAFDQTSVEVIATIRDGTWGMVNAGEGVGWVAMRFMRISAGTPDNLPEQLACSGTEPFWSLEFAPGGTAFADWSPMGLTNDKQSVYANFWSNSPSNRATRSWGFVLQDQISGSPVGVTGFIRTELCNDGMSDREFGFSVDVILKTGDQTLVSGCCSISPP